MTAPLEDGNRPHRAQQILGDITLRHIGLEDEWALAQLPEDKPASQIAFEISHEMWKRGLRDLDVDVLTALVLRCLIEHDYRIVRRNPPAPPVDSELTPMTMHGPGSVVDLRERFSRRAEDERIEKSRGDAPGWVYYLRVHDKIKIGFSSRIKQRLKSYPPESELLAVHPGTTSLEHQIHKEFAAFLSHGREWFTPNAALSDHIDGVNDQYGPPPDRLKHRYRKRRSDMVRPRNWSGK